jgi:hypothetical protein
VLPGVIHWRLKRGGHFPAQGHIRPVAYHHGSLTLSALLHTPNYIISWDASVVLRSHREIFWMHEVCSRMHPAILVTITQLKPALFSVG